MQHNISKAYAITDAKISFVSLVNKAANKKEFLITKCDNGEAKFTTNCKILKADKNNHYVTGIVYEPMTEDAHGNYMTEAEITKAAYWFAKNGNQCDIQHNFEKLENSAVVESYVTKGDMEIDGQKIKKGTWMMTVEIDEDTFEKVEKGELTGFSMGGVGKYSQVDVDLPDDDNEKGLIAKIAKIFGLSPINKGAITDEYNRRIKSSNFSEAFATLRQVLENFDPVKARYEFDTDETNIRNALVEFNEIVVDLLTEKSITKALNDMNVPNFITKAGKKVSGPRLKTLKDIQAKVSELIAEVDDEKEEIDMDSKELEKAIAKAMEPVITRMENIEKSLSGAKTSISGKDIPVPEGDVKKSDADVIGEAIAKALEPVTAKMDSMSATVDAIAKAKNLPSNLNDDGDGKPVQKGEDHYMKGIL